jgi:hypothetical protein
VYFGQLIYPESYVQYVAAHPGINMQWIEQAKQIMSVEKLPHTNGGILDKLHLCDDDMPALNFKCGTKFYDITVFKNSTEDFKLAKQYGKLRAKTHEKYGITSDETEYRATDGKAREKCESAYKACKAKRIKRQYVLLTSKSNTISSPLDLSNNNAASPIILPLQTTSIIAEKKTPTKKRKMNSSNSVAEKKAPKKRKQIHVPAWLEDAQSRIKTVDVPSGSTPGKSLDLRLVEWKRRKSDPITGLISTTLRYLLKEDSVYLQAKHSISVTDLKEELTAAAKRIRLSAARGRWTEEHKAAHGGLSKKQVKTIEHRAAHDGKSEYQVLTEEHKAAHDGKSYEQVLTEQHRAAHDGKSSYQVQTEANGGMSLFNLKDEKYRAAHKGHSEYLVKRILAQVAEKAYSINAQQMEGIKQLTDDDSDFAKALSMLDAMSGTGDAVEDIVEMASSVFNQERPCLLRRKKEGCMAYANKAGLMNIRDWWCEVRSNGHVTGDKVFNPMFGTETDGMMPTYTFDSEYASRYDMCL